MYTRKKRGLLQYIDFIFLDLLIIECVYMMACYVRIHVRINELPYIYDKMNYIFVLLTFVVGSVLPTYKDILKRRAYQEIMESFFMVSIINILAIIYLYLTKNGQDFSRGIIIAVWVIATMAISIVRIVYKKFLLKVCYKSNLLPQVILITESDRNYHIKKYLRKNYDDRYDIKGIVYIDDENKFNNKFYQHILGDLNSLDLYLKTNVVDEIIIDINDVIYAQEIAKQLLISGVTVHINIQKIIRDLPNPIVETIFDENMITASQKIATPIEVWIKRAMDIVGGIVGMICVCIAFIIFAPIIFVQSPGPVFYSQWRIGRNGRKFKLYKFRSMCVNADSKKKELMESNKMEGLMFKIDDDPRIIPIGHFMRKHSIDELPQFFNVLKGDMSLVGTRPPTVDEWELYNVHHRARLGIKPGLTGLWQTSGRSDIIDFEEVVKMDLKYIREWSILKDIQLILKTIEIVITGEGSV